MPDLSFQVEGVEPAERGLTPLLRFRLRVGNTPADEQIQGGMLHAQIQLQPAQRRYAPAEKARLVELFGPPERWGQTLRNRLWTHADATLPTFAGTTEVSLWIPCTFDLNIAATKYFHALETGPVALLLLFSGTVFFTAPGGRMQMQRIGWDKECRFEFPASTWQALMARHYPNCGWVDLRQDVLDRLYRYKCDHGCPTWEETVERLLATADVTEEVTA